MTQKQENIRDTSDAELAPVDLDPPDPALVRWQHLADRDISVRHDGDASKVLAFPRPAWADAAFDQVGVGWRDTCYRSEPVDVALKNGKSCMSTESVWEPASIRVSGHQFGGGDDPMIQLSIRKLYDSEVGWRYFGAGMRLEEATELAHVLLAAVALVGGER
ncbi:hypothetical protein FIV07_22485 [Mycobacterium sp. THAF192]|nr:hypothetical protein FIV07_22485 [Mycobacterium sp. THAF192]